MMLDVAEGSARGFLAASGHIVHSLCMACINCVNITPLCAAGRRSHHDIALRQPCLANKNDMAQTQAASPPGPVKRGPGRPPRAAQPPLKKVKASETPAQSSPSVQSPSGLSPTPSNTASKLPTKLSDYRPLPTLPSPQSLSLPAATHQSLAASGVLQASLDRSRLRWVHHGMFDRYWTKPETGKNARPPPPNNPEAKWMKHRGPCRIRVEPHIFECEVYVEEKPKPALQKVQPQAQYGQSAYGGYGGQYRPGPGQPGQPYGQQRPFGAHQQTPVRQSPAPLPPHRPQQNTPQQQADKKPGPDPVISMLATRASSDPELKALMKEVATGAATAEQLKVFQGHIDELTKIINEKKKKEEEEAAAAEAKKAREQQQDAIQYDGAADQRQPPPHQPSPLYQQQQTWQPPAPAVQSPAPPPPPPTAPPVILQFTTPGATEDRFLFPQNSILEPLSAQHLLCSTLITRTGLAATSFAPLDPGTEYFQPVTFMVEVAYGRESLIELVKKWVRPADEVRAWMEATMARCTRAPEAHLALRLPVRGAAGAETEEERAEVEGKLAEEMRRRVGTGANVKFVRKPGPKKGEGGRPVGVKNGEGGGRKAAGKDGVATGAGAQAPSGDGKGTEKAESSKDAGAGEGEGGEASQPADGTAEGEKKKEEAQAEEGEGDGAGRPKRAVRKSVRISEG